MSSHLASRPDPYNDVVIRLRTADDAGIRLEARLTQTTANLKAVSQDLQETQKALYEEHRSRLACQNDLLLEQQRHRECVQAYQSVHAQCQPLTNQVYGLTASNKYMQQQLDERNRILALNQRGAWFQNETGAFVGAPKRHHLPPGNVQTLTATNLDLHQGMNGRNTTPAAKQNTFEVKKNSNWRPSMAAGSLNSGLNAANRDQRSDKEAEIALRMAEINQEKASLMNEHHKDLLAASDHAVESGVKLQATDPKSETRAIHSPEEEFYDGLPSMADLDDDETKIPSDGDAEVDTSEEGREFKRPRTLRRLRPKDPNVTVNCG